MTWRPEDARRRFRNVQDLHVPVAPQYQLGTGKAEAPRRTRSFPKRNQLELTTIVRKHGNGVALGRDGDAIFCACEGRHGRWSRGRRQDLQIVGRQAPLVSTFSVVDPAHDMHGRPGGDGDDLVEFRGACRLLNFARP